MSYLERPKREGGRGLSVLRRMRSERRENLLAQGRPLPELVAGSEEGGRKELLPTHKPCEEKEEKDDDNMSSLPQIRNKGGGDILFGKLVGVKEKEKGLRRHVVGGRKKKKRAANCSASRRHLMLFLYVPKGGGAGKKRKRRANIMLKNDCPVRGNEARGKKGTPSLKA